MKLVQIVCLDEIFDMGHAGSKTRSLGQMFKEKLCRTDGQNFIPTPMKLDQNVCLDKMSDEFENGS